MSRRTLTLVAASLLAVSMLAGLTHGLHSLAEGLLTLSPALLLLVPLLAGRYLGEDAIDRVRNVRVAVPERPRRRRAPRPAHPRPVAALVPRGGLLLASRLATRPPPA